MVGAEANGSSVDPLLQLSAAIDSLPLREEHTTTTTTMMDDGDAVVAVPQKVADEAPVLHRDPQAGIRSSPSPASPTLLQPQDHNRGNWGSLGPVAEAANPNPRGIPGWMERQQHPIEPGVVPHRHPFAVAAVTTSTPPPQPTPLPEDLPAATTMWTG